MEILESPASHWLAVIFPPLRGGKKVKVKVIQSCLILCDPMGDTVHAILQARILEW